MKYGFENSIIDISHHQGDVNFDLLLNSGVKAIIHKATQGTKGIDARFQARKKIAKDRGFLFGSYHFATAGIVKTQVEHYLSFAKPAEDELIVIDYELNTSGGGTMSLMQLVEAVELIKVRTGRYPVIYSGALIKEELGDDEDPTLKNCPLWISHYTHNSQPKIPANWKTWSLWQYTDGNQPGSKSYPKVYTNGAGYVDRNYFNGDFDGLQRLWGVNLQATAINGLDKQTNQEAKPGEVSQS